MTSAYLEPCRPRLFGHRGGSAHFPENTLPAFQAALEAGLPYLEMDVWATRDRVVVVHHDETLQRLCGVDRRLPEVNLDELKRMDAGFGFTADAGASYPFRGKGITVPTLEEVLLAFPKAFFNIEIKQSEPPIEQITLETIKTAGLEDRVLLAAENHQVMKRIRTLCGDIPTSLSRAELEEFFTWVQAGCRTAYRPAGKALQIPECYGGKVLVSPQTLQAAGSLGMEVHVWTVNDPQAMKRLLAMGVDGIMSDRPKDLVRVAGEFHPGAPPS